MFQKAGGVHLCVCWLECAVHGVSIWPQIFRTLSLSGESPRGLWHGLPGHALPGIFSRREKPVGDLEGAGSRLVADRMGFFSAPFQAGSFGLKPILFQSFCIMQLPPLLVFSL